MELRVNQCFVTFGAREHAINADLWKRLTACGFHGRMNATPWLFSVSQRRESSDHVSLLRAIVTGIGIGSKQ